jgi:hypothetical protein
MAAITTAICGRRSKLVVEQAPSLPSTMSRGGLAVRTILKNLEALWAWEHAAVDPFRFYTGPTP